MPINRLAKNNPSIVIILVDAKEIYEAGNSDPRLTAKLSRICSKAIETMSYSRQENWPSAVLRGSSVDAIAAQFVVQCDEIDFAHASAVVKQKWQQLSMGNDGKFQTIAFQLSPKVCGSVFFVKRLPRKTHFFNWIPVNNAFGIQIQGFEDVRYDRTTSMKNVSESERELLHHFNNLTSRELLELLNETFGRNELARLLNKSGSYITNIIQGERIPGEEMSQSIRRLAIDSLDF